MQTKRSGPIEMLLDKPFNLGAAIVEIVAGDRRADPIGCRGKA